MNIGGTPVRTKAETDQSEKTFTEFIGPGHREYEGSVRALNQLEGINNSMDHLAKTLLEPGAWGEKRVEVGKTWNTILDLAQQAGIKVDDKYRVDATQLASAEAFMKESKLLQFATVTQAFGAQREAAQTIMSAGQAVPSMNNTFMGNKLLLESLKAASQRMIDLRAFQVNWLRDPRSGRDLTGAQEEFDRLHPLEDYGKAVREKFGMDKDGFKDEAAITRAAQNKWIDAKLAASEYKRLQEKQQQQPAR